MNAWDGGIGPGPLNGFPGRDDPPVTLGGTAGGERRAEDALFIAGFREFRCTAEHDAHLDPETGEFGFCSIGQFEAHAEATGETDCGGFEGNPVGETSPDGEPAFLAAIPFESIQGEAAFGPDGGDVGVGQVSETEIGPDGFREIDHNVGSGIPGGEDADFGFPLWIDGPFEETGARMASAGIGEHAEPAIWGREAARSDGEAFESFLDGGGLEPGGGLDLLEAVAVVCDHVFQPKGEIGFGNRMPVFLWGNGRHTG